MYAAIATEPGQTAKQNEDWAGVSPSVAVLLDGLSSSADAETGCEHGTPWFVQQLGARLLATAGDLTCDLKEALAVAIDQVAQLHPLCDLANNDAPSTTVALLRTHPDRDVVEYLVLADARVVFESSTGISVITDNRVDQVAGPARDAALREPIGSPAHRIAVAELIATQKPMRNQPGGYWIAAADPAAAAHSVTGSLPCATLTHAALFSDGASRLVDVFERATWKEALDLLHDRGPQHLIHRVREIEASDPDGRRWPRYKTSDDATVLYMKWRPE